MIRMENQKLENLLNLALSATPEEREKSESLEVGYEPKERMWELIVKYHGDISQVGTELVQVEPLLSGYAIVTIREGLIDAFSALENVEYIEKPKRFFFSILEAKRASCIPEVMNRQPFLSGRGVLTAVVDSGERVIIMPQVIRPLGLPCFCTGVPVNRIFEYCTI